MMYSLKYSHNQPNLCTWIKLLFGFIFTQCTIVTFYQEKLNLVQPSLSLVLTVYNELWLMNILCLKSSLRDALFQNLMILKTSVDELSAIAKAYPDWLLWNVGKNCYIKPTKLQLLIGFCLWASHDHWPNSDGTHASWGRRIVFCYSLCLLVLGWGFDPCLGLGYMSFSQ